MLSWLRAKVQRYRQWRDANEASWLGFDKPNTEGITQFQAELLQALQQSPGVAAVKLVWGASKNIAEWTSK